MTIPKWLLPVIAVVAALAVAAAAVLVGMRFATPTVTSVAAPTVIAPVLAPVDPAVPLSTALDANGNLPSSDVLGSREVTAPGTFPVGSVPSDMDARLDDLIASDDPTDPGTMPPGDSPAPAGDPCSPADGSAPADDCPGGLHSVILHDIALPAFSATVSQPAGCGYPQSDTTLSLEVVTNSPATTVLHYSQDGYTDGTLNLASTQDQNDAWQAALAAADHLDSWIWVRVCFQITPVDPWLGTRITLTSTDFMGRPATYTHTWNPNRYPTRPPTDIMPVGDSTVLVSAPAKTGDEVRIRAFVVPPGQVADCDNAPELTGTLQVIRPLETHDVSRESLTAAHYDPTFTKRITTAFAVPESTKVMVCVRWYAPGRASWDRDTPSFRSELVLASPDLAAPVVTLDSVVLSGAVPAGSVQISGSTEDGIDCFSGAWTGPAATGSTVDLSAGHPELCDYGALLGRANVNGALNITTRVTTPNGVAVMPHLLPIQLAPCAGSCPARSQSFDVPLSSFVRPTGLCSGDCPTNTGQSVGTARVTARWQPGLSSGQVGWYFGERVDGPASVLPPDYPRMDDAATVTLGSVDTANRSQSASFTLRTDRPVSYRVDLNPGACLRPGGVNSIVSSVGTTSDVVHLTGLCLGTGYSLTVTLSDSAGHVSVYSLGRSDHLWLGGQFFTAAAHSALTAQLRVSKPGGGLVYVRTIQVDAAFQRLGIAVQPAQECWDGAITPARTSESPDLREVIPIAVYVAYLPGDQPQREYLHPDGSLRCTPVAGADQLYLHLTGSVTMEQIAAGASVVMTDPDSGYTATLALHNR